MLSRVIQRVDFGFNVLVKVVIMAIAAFGFGRRHLLKWFADLVDEGFVGMELDPARFGRDFRLRRHRSADLVCVGFLVDEGDTIGPGFGFGRERRVRLEGLLDGGASNFLGAGLLGELLFS